MPICIICGLPYSNGRQYTCSDACHAEFRERVIAQFGEYKKVVRGSTGEAFKVPTFDVIEYGINEQDLDQYPRWAEE